MMSGGTADTTKLTDFPKDGFRGNATETEEDGAEALPYFALHEKQTKKQEPVKMTEL